MLDLLLCRRDRRPVWKVGGEIKLVGRKRGEGRDDARGGRLSRGKG